MGHPLFRQLTTRCTTAMDTKMPKPEMPEETPEERERLLSLTAPEAIEHLEAAGGL